MFGDGAPWIWNQAALHFGASRQVVDWYHAKQHLAAAGRPCKARRSRHSHAGSTAGKRCSARDMPPAWLMNSTLRQVRAASLRALA